MLYSLAVSISTLTAFTTPHALRFSGPISERLERWMDETLPSRWLQGLRSYQAAAQRISGEDDLRQSLKSQTAQAILNSVVVVALGVLAKKFLKPDVIISWAPNQISPWLASAIAVFILVFVASPFLWAVAFSGFKNNIMRSYFKIPGERVPLILLSIVRALVAFVLLGYLLSRFLPFRVGIFFVLGTVAAGFFLLSKRLERIYEAFMSRFLLNLSERDRDEKTKETIAAPPALLPWDSHLEEYQVSVDSALVGQTLGSLAIREKYAVTIAMIERGKKRIPAPPRDTVIYPGDRLYVLGEDQRLVAFRSEVEKDSASSLDLHSNDSFHLHPIALDSASPWVSKSIRDCGIREGLQGLVVGVERSGARHLNPAADWVLNSGDLVWVVGNTRLIKDWVKKGPPKSSS